MTREITIVRRHRRGLRSASMCHMSLRRSRCVSSGLIKGCLQNGVCCTTEMRAGLSSKLFAPTLGQAMLEVMPWTLVLSKSPSILLWSPPAPAIFSEVLLALHLYSSSWNWIFYSSDTPRARHLRGICGGSTYAQMGVKCAVKIAQNPLNVIKEPYPRIKWE